MRRMRWLVRVGGGEVLSVVADGVIGYVECVDVEESGDDREGDFISDFIVGDVEDLKEGVGGERFRKNLNTVVREVKFAKLTQFV